VGDQSWIVLDLVVHGAALHDEGSAPQVCWRRLRDALGIAPHRVVSWSNSGEQGLIYMTTTDPEALLQTARDHAPGERVASFAAKIWSVDPRRTDEPPKEIALTSPHPRWPQPGYADDLLERWVDAASRESSVSPN
jgi:hypothetical protein